MSKLIIYRGLPASGKSTDAAQRVAEDFAGTIRINRDSLRQMCHGGEFVKGVTEEKILRSRNALIEAHLKAGMTVLCDDTNLPMRTIKDLVKLANKHGAIWEIADFTHVDLATCIQRDAERPFPEFVGESVITDMYNRFLKGNRTLDLSSLTTEEVVIEPYVADSGRSAYIVDIDGTVALMKGARSPYDYTKVSGDSPNQAVIDLVNTLWHSGKSIIFCSGRPESCREETEAWLNKFVKVPFVLLMRSTGDMRADYIIKLEIFNQSIRNSFNVLGVFDDRNQVVELWRKLGLTCFQVADGAF